MDQAPHDSSNAVILKAGYLVRTAKVTGNALALTGDVNATTPLEILGGAPGSLSKLTFNNQDIKFNVTKEGVVTSTLAFSKPNLNLVQLNGLNWKYIDSLPEAQSGYDDSKWTKANLQKTYNSLVPLKTPMSLYSSDYGYHTGTLLYRGTFTSTGKEANFYVAIQGGSAFGSSAWIGDQFLGSWRGSANAQNGDDTFTLPKLTAGKTYTVTVVVDNQGLDEDGSVGSDGPKHPRGILDFSLDGHNKSDVSWKLTGNLGGEDYQDISRGPLNEGGLFIERQGLHLPGAFSASDVGWKASKGPVVDGLGSAGIGFFGVEFDLNVPAGYDIPLSFTFSTPSSNSGAQRVQIYINGWQYGKYVSNIGPQTKYPVPEGILNYNGTNYLGISLWGLDAGETKLGGLELSADAYVWSGRGTVDRVEGQVYKRREGRTEERLMFGP